jgi:predicted RND superfamily exporter protein
VKHLEKLVQPFTEFKKVHFAGKCFGQTTFVNLTKTEIVLFILLSIIVNIVFLYFTYRRFWGIWMPLLFVCVTVLWTHGNMMMFGLSLDFISNIIPTIILIIGISNVIHFLTHFIMEMDSGKTKIDAIKITIKKIGTATIFTSLTTIIGFLSLLFSNVKPLVNLGGYASLGLVFAFIITYTLFPAILVVFNTKYSAKSKSATDFLQNILEPLFNFTMKFKLQIIIFSAFVLAFGIWGSLKLVVNQHLLEDINDRHPQIQAARFFEEDFSWLCALIIG